MGCHQAFLFGMVMTPEIDFRGLRGWVSLSHGGLMRAADDTAHFYREKCLPSFAHPTHTPRVTYLRFV